MAKHLRWHWFVGNGQQPACLQPLHSHTSRYSLRMQKCHSSGNTPLHVGVLLSGIPIVGVKHFPSGGCRQQTFAAISQLHPSSSRVSETFAQIAGQTQTWHKHALHCILCLMCWLSVTGWNYGYRPQPKQ